MGKHDVHYLMIIEVSQKQAFVFDQNELKNNVEHSDIIDYVTSLDFFKSCYPDFESENNSVYSGGGHAVVCFDTKEEATAFAKAVSREAMKFGDKMEYYLTTIDCTELEKRESSDLFLPGVMHTRLVEQLERKKARRLSSFRQGTFGVEALSKEGMRVENITGLGKKVYYKSREIPKPPEVCKYIEPAAFDKLGGSKEDTNFIAVVHIDGNGMGKRVAKLYENRAALQTCWDCNGGEAGATDWDIFCKGADSFSKALDRDFISAFNEMREDVAHSLQSERWQKTLDLEPNTFPLRRIITEGDDFCFVCDGRIGLSCAVSLIEHLKKKNNEIDKQGYAACAGVAIVHQKYPFYKAYELAESLCGNAKKFGASVESDGSISAIDWHIEFGEMKDSLSDIRKDYIVSGEENEYLNLRPLVIDWGTTQKEKQSENALQMRDYYRFEKQIKRFSNTGDESDDDQIVRGKLKQLRAKLKEGEEAANAFITFYKMQKMFGIRERTNDTHEASGQMQSLYFKDEEQKKRCLIFDAIELVDVYLPMEKGDVDHESKN